MLGEYETDYRWLVQVYESVKPVSTAGQLLWHRLDAKTIELIHENVHVDAVHDDLDQRNSLNLRTISIPHGAIAHSQVTSTPGDQRQLPSSFVNSCCRWSNGASSDFFRSSARCKDCVRGRVDLGSFHFDRGRLLRPTPTEPLGPVLADYRQQQFSRMRCRDERRRGNFPVAGVFAFSHLKPLAREESK